jgi:Yip1 domain
MDPELSYASKNANTAPEPKPQSFFSRLSGVYFSPGETFQEIGRAPNVLVPIIALVLIVLAGNFIVSGKMPWVEILERPIQQQVDSGRIPPEAGEVQKEQLRRIGAPIMRWTAPFFLAAYFLVLALIFAGGARLVSLILGVENYFKSLLSVSVYSILAVNIIATILFIILIFIKPVDEFDWENPLSTNLAAFLTLAGLAEMPKYLKTFLTYIDVFFIWRLALLAIGFAAVSKKLKTSTSLAWLVIVSLLIIIGHTVFVAAVG